MMLLACGFLYKLRQQFLEAIARQSAFFPRIPSKTETEFEPYIVYTTYFPDDSPPGSYDFTLERGWQPVGRNSLTAQWGNRLHLHGHHPGNRMEIPKLNWLGLTH